MGIEKDVVVVHSASHSVTVTRPFFGLKRCTRQTLILLNLPYLTSTFASPGRQVESTYYACLDA